MRIPTVGLLVTVVMTAGVVEPAPATHQDLLQCQGIDAQQDLDIEQMLGRWYGVEIVHHREDSPLPKGVSVVDVCPVLELVMPDYSPHESRHPNRPVTLKMHWVEDAGNVDYNFIIYRDQPGNWISAGSQNGSLLEQPYKQFAGKVSVTKAVRNHMVLTFCSTGSELYSIVMSRTPRLLRRELNSIHSMLEYRGLERHAVRETCRGGGAALAALLSLAVSMAVAVRLAS